MNPSLLCILRIQMWLYVPAHDIVMYIYIYICIHTLVLQTHNQVYHAARVSRCVCVCGCVSFKRLACVCDTHVCASVYLHHRFSFTYHCITLSSSIDVTSALYMRINIGSVIIRIGLWAHHTITI